MENNEIERWAEHGSGLAGGLTGALISVATAVDPTGAIVGSAVGSGLETVLSEAAHRIMSKREKKRVGALVLLAKERLTAKLGEGKILRTDDFVRPEIDGRSPYEEVIDQVLQVAQRTFEERKLPYIAATLASVAVSTNIDSATAHWALTALESLSWHKLVVLAVIGQTPQRPLPSFDPEGPSAGPRAWPAQRAIVELFETDKMLKKALEPEEGTFSLGTPNVDDLKLSPAGQLLFDLADLSTVPENDMDELVARLNGS